MGLPMITCNDAAYLAIGTAAEGLTTLFLRKVTARPDGSSAFPSVYTTFLITSAAVAYGVYALQPDVENATTRAVGGIILGYGISQFIGYYLPLITGAPCESATTVRARRAIRTR